VGGIERTIRDYTRCVIATVEVGFDGVEGMGGMGIVRDPSPDRCITGATPFFSAGRWSNRNSWSVLESGAYDALVLGDSFWRI